MKTICLLLLVALAQTAYSQLVEELEGKCPSIRYYKSFEADEFAGVWYGWGGYAPNVRNVYTTYDQIDSKNFKVTISQQDVKTCATETITFSATNDVVSFTDTTYNGKYNFNVLNTDYENYANRFFCRNLNATHFSRIVTIDTRDKFPSRLITNFAGNGLAQSRIWLTSSAIVDQNPCTPTQ